MFHEVRAGEISHFCFGELEAIPGFFHAFTSRRTDSELNDASSPRESANSKPAFLKSLGLRPEDGLTLRQVHSATVFSSREAAGSTLRSDQRMAGDGLLLETAGDWGVVRTADCLAILLLAPRSRQVCLLHAGWRGTCDWIAREGARRLLESSGADPDGIVAAFGPAIRSCCYEVGPDVRVRFEDAGHDLARVFKDRRLDLIRANTLALRELGIGPPLDSGLCTACGGDRFYSWRKNRDEGRMWALAGFREAV